MVNQFQNKPPVIEKKLRNPEEIKGGAEHVLQNLISDNIISSVFFLYRNNYQSRAFYWGTIEGELEEINISGDVVYLEALELHKKDFCFSIRTNEIPEESQLYDLLIEYTEESKIFYISCPVRLDGVLIGYLSSVIERSSNGFLIDYNNVFYLARKLEDQLVY